MYLAKISTSSLPLQFSPPGFTVTKACTQTAKTTSTLYTANVLSKEQTLETLKIKKLYDQLVLTSEKSLGYLKFIGTVPDKE